MLPRAFRLRLPRPGRQPGRYLTQKPVRAILMRVRVHGAGALHVALASAGIDPVRPLRNMQDLRQQLGLLPRVELERLLWALRS